MLIFLYSLLFIIFVIISLFAFPQFSPIPYFPSNKKDLKLIVKTLRLQNNQTIIDLGAGDGMVIFEAAKKTYEEKLNTKFIAVDINPILLLIMHIRRLFHRNKKNIKIIYGNMFTMNFNQFTLSEIEGLTSKQSNSLTFYLYISPWYLEKVISNF
ncbi:MAG: class I SAM-dependent methyltransferase, partial [bacterium]|nr:class I SAM-dependent methyltransferase [bacterium]